MCNLLVGLKMVCISSKSRSAAEISLPVGQLCGRHQSTTGNKAC